MRATLETSAVTVAPGSPARLAVEVTNTTEVIDGVRASLDAGEGLAVEYEPALLPLFPEGTGVITLTLSVTPTFPAGTHQATVELSSTVRPDERLASPLEVEVTPTPAASLETVPTVRSDRRRGTFSIVGHNQGNTPVALSLVASDAARALVATFDPPVLTVGPGATASAEMSVVSRRQWFGTEHRRPVTVVGTGSGLELDTSAVFVQRPMISRGVRTALVLGVIVALWALAFLFALNRALAQDALTKDVPPSFYAADAAASSPAAFSANVSGGETDVGGVPPGAVPKAGVVIGVGGAVAGKVTALSTGAGVARITVEAIRNSTAGPVLVSSAATGADGSYAIDGLLPGAYKILFTAQGFTNVWWPAAAGAAGAEPVTVAALTTHGKVNAVIAGLPGSITGVVATGQTPSPTVTVSVTPEGGAASVASVQTDAQGNYVIPNLSTPGTYDLSFTSTGYLAGTDTEELGGGENRIANNVTLTAGNGTIAGTVTNGTTPLGGVTISANANGKTVTSATPTTGSVGQFTIPNLTTPATYLLTFTLPGFGTQTQAVQLGPGQDVTNLAITLVGGAGQVSGTASAPSGAPLGGVTVTVNGNGPSTETLTGGSVGSYLLSGLATPGAYTLTFSLAGYVSQTVGVTLASSGSATAVNVTLPLSNGSITGTVSSPSSTPLVGVAVSVTDGTTVRTTTTASTPPGGFDLTGLPPETYSVTFSATGYVSQTAEVPLAPGGSPTLNIVLVASS